LRLRLSRSMINSMELPDGWYAIAESREISPNKPLGIRRFGIDLVLWRADDKLVVMVDRCPHRSAKLSLHRTDTNFLGWSRCSISD
jgi:phenylpropionate dioxygenase-like ring-hydroxylating dioxygenase large terminal subunit